MYHDLERSTDAHHDRNEAKHRAKLLELAARRGAKGFSQLVTEALDAYLRVEADREAQRKRTVLLKGALSSRDAKALRDAAEALRRTWR